MILRKPYAIFIKYFKLLHTVMSVFIAILLYNSIRIYNYFRVYSIDYRSTVDSFFSNDIGIFSYFCIFFILLLTVVLLAVMFYKNKPKDIYVYNFILYILVFVLYVFCGDAIDSTSSLVLNIKSSKALRDFSLIACGFQLISLIITIVRATGFDIKRFDFNTDLQELNISSADSEEIEVALEFDKDKIRTNFRNKIRLLKYFYFEHKFMINISSALFVLIVFGFIYFRIRTFRVNEQIGKSFNVGNYTFNVQDAYIVDKDVNGNKVVSDGGVFLAVRIQVKGYGNKLTLNKGIINLSIDGLNYGVDMESAKVFSDLGLAYTKQIITSDFSTYLFVFEVAESQVHKRIQLKINDYTGFVGDKFGAKNYYIKLRPKDLRKNDKLLVSKKIGQTINFSDSVIGSSSFIINKYEINDVFKLDYKYCYESDKCINSYEYLSATATGNYFKTLMRINGNISIDRTKNINSFKDFISFLNNYGVIYYKINNEWRSSKISSSVIKPTSAITSDIFAEVPYEIKDASEIYFYFKIRNQNYKYTLK